ncbi:5'-nucleotidase C-terminal domain-containing protein [Halomonas sp. CH40]
MSNFKLQLLHAADMEGGGGDLLNAPNFVSIVDYLEDQYANTLFVSSGDLILPGPYLAAAGDDSIQPALQQAAELIYDLPEGSLSGISAESGRIETLLADLIGIDAVTFGNHEFDQGTELIADMLAPMLGENPTLEEIQWLGASFPYLSANLDFSADENLAGLATDQVLEADAFQATADELLAGATPPKIAPAMIQQVGDEKVGVIGLTTQILESISSPGETQVLAGGSNDMQALAELVQPIIDDLENQGVNKIVLASHLQQIQFEEELATLLEGVDIVMAGGSNTLLADAEDAERGLFPAAPEPYDTYPIITQDAAGNDVAIINTDAGWRYVGQLVVEFDENGRLLVDSLDEDTSGVYASTDDQVEALWGSKDAAFAEGTKGAIADTLVDSVAGFVAEQDGNILGLSDVYLVGEREAVRTEETNLGNLTADANLWYARQQDADVMVSFKNGGGIREPVGQVVVEGSDGEPRFEAPAGNEAIGKPEGGVSQLDAASTLRFNNDLTILTLTRAKLVELLEHAVAASAPDVTPGQFAQVSGIQYSFDWDQPAGERIQSAAIVDDAGATQDILVAGGELIGNADEAIKVVTLGFLANGGDGYPLDETSILERTDLVESDLKEGQFNFAQAGTEQDALAEYMAAMFSEVAYSETETPASEDTRIQNLDVRDDKVLNEGVDPLLRLYDGALDRIADSEGLNYWLDKVEELTLNEIGEYFIGSEEFQATNGGLDDSAFIDLMYVNVLERSADVEGKAYWVEQLASGDSQGAVLIGFTESEESLALM